MQPIPLGPWYYQIEVAPGVFTPGMQHYNLSICRSLLKQVDVTDLRCLDIGTQEFVIPILLYHAGAAEIIAYDRLSNTPKLEFIKPIYNFNATYVHGISLNDLKKHLIMTGLSQRFDFVNFTGVLYHMVDP